MLDLLLLLLAIIFEVCGDATIRKAMWFRKPMWFICGAAMVICYGTLVNFPSWSFSRTMGVYIAMFFIVSQCVSRLLLGESIAPPTLVGGLLIISGGLVILLWHPAPGR